VTGRLPAALVELLSWVAAFLAVQLAARLLAVVVQPAPAGCSTCGEPMTAPPCSLNSERDWSGHTVAGGVQPAGDAWPHDALGDRR